MALRGGQQWAPGGCPVRTSSQRRCSILHIPRQPAPVVTLLVKRTLRLAAIVFVIQGTVIVFIGQDPVNARLPLSIGLLSAMLYLWLDWRDRRP